MITNSSKTITFVAPDPAQHDVLSRSRPPTIQTAAERSGTDVVVSVSRKTGDTMLLDPQAPMDADKVEMIRQQLAQGGFKFDTSVVADRMMADH